MHPEEDPLPPSNHNNGKQRHFCIPRSSVLRLHKSAWTNGWLDNVSRPSDDWMISYHTHHWMTQYHSGKNTDLLEHQTYRHTRNPSRSYTTHTNTDLLARAEAGPLSRSDDSLPITASAMGPRRWRSFVLVASRYLWVKFCVYIYIYIMFIYIYIMFGGFEIPACRFVCVCT